MRRRKDRIIIDTNLFISFLINNDFARLNNILNNRHVTLLLSKELISEFIEVSQRQKFKKYFPQLLVRELLHKLYIRSEIIEVSSIVEVCSDPKDNFLLALAKDGKASHLITGDKELLALKKSSRTEILTIKHYLDRI